jgi:hypothetical protein
VLLAAGCSGDPESSGAAAPTPAVPAPVSAPTVSVAATPGGAPVSGTGGTGSTAGGRNAGDAALAGNTRAICDQARKTSGNFAATFAQDLKLLIDAASADDPALVAKAEEKTRRDVQNYSFALKDMSQLAADPTVKKALADMGKQVTALQGDVRRIDDRRLAALSGTLDRACGTA